MPVIEFPDIGQKVEVQDGYTDKDLEEIYSTLTRQFVPSVGNKKQSDYPTESPSMTAQAVAPGTPRIEREPPQQKSLLEVQPDYQRDLVETERRKFLDEWDRRVRQEGTLDLTDQENNRSLGSVATTPLVRIPRVSPVASGDTLMQPTQAKILAGGVNAIASLAEFFTSPLGIATMGTASLPAKAQQAIAGVFAVDMARHTPEIVDGFAEAWSKGDTQSATEMAASGALNTLFATGAARHALKGSPTKAEAIGREMQKYLDHPDVKKTLEQAAADEALARTLPSNAQERVSEVKPTPPIVEELKAADATLTAGVTEKVMREKPEVPGAPEQLEGQPYEVEPPPTGEPTPSTAPTAPAPAAAPTTPTAEVQPVHYFQSSSVKPIDAFTHPSSDGFYYFSTKKNVLEKMIKAGASKDVSKPTQTVAVKLTAKNPLDLRELRGDRLDVSPQEFVKFLESKGVSLPAELRDRIMSRRARDMADFQLLKYGPSGLKKALADAGYDSVKFDEWGGTTTAVMEASQIEMAKKGKPFTPAPAAATATAEPKAAPITEKVQEPWQMTVEEQHIADGTKRVGDTYVPPVSPKSVSKTSIEAFVSSMTPMAKSRAKNALDNSIFAEGMPYRRSELVEKDVAKGATVVVTKEGKRRLQKPNGAYRDESQISKTAMDYAEYLITNREQPTPATTQAAPITEKVARDVVNQEPPAPSVGAAAKEGSGEFDQPTSLKNATAELERELHGFPEATPTERQAMVPAMERAMATIETDKLAGDRLADEVIADPRRRLTGDDSALLLLHKRNLIELKNQAASDTFSLDPDIKKAANKRFDEYSERLLKLLDAVKVSGSHTGRELRWRQALMFEDYSFETMLRDKSKAMDREIKPGDVEWEQIKTLNKRIEELEKQLKEKESKKSGEDRESEADDAFADIADKAEKTRKRTRKEGVERDINQERKDVIDNLKERFTEEGDLVGSNASIRKLMEILYEDGYRERVPMEKEVHRILTKEVDPTITLEETQDLMSGYGKFKELSKEPTKVGVRGIVGEIQQVRKLLDFWQGKAPAKTGMERRQATQAERDYQKVVNEAKKRFGTIATDPAKALQSALAAIETRLKNRLADLKQEVATRHKIIKERAPTPYNEETNRLRKEIDEVKKEWDEIFGKTELTDAQKLERAEKSALRREEELKRQLRTGEIFPKSKITTEQRSAILDATKARIKALEEERYWARDLAQPKEEPHVKVLRQILDRLRKQEIQFKEKLAKGDFSKRVKKERPSSPEILDARAKVEQAKHEFLKGLDEDRRARFNKWEKLADASKRTSGAFVNVVSSFDLSAPRQALFAILSNVGRLASRHPGRAGGMLARPFDEMFRAWSNEATARRIEQKIKDRPNYKAGLDQAAGVSYTDLETNRFTRYEENAHSVIDKWSQLPYRTGSTGKTIATAVPKAFVKGVRASNRAFITFLNRTRADLFDELLRANFSDRVPTKQELQHVGELVNLATGRGTLNPKIASTLSHVLWAPKLLASRVQTLTGVPFVKGIYHYSLTKDPVILKMVAKEYARVIGSAFLLGTVAHLFSDDGEKEITSSDYGKIIRGDTRIDIWGGYQQLVVLFNRIAKQETTTLTGKTKSTGPDKPYGSDDGYVILSKFARSKLRPDVGSALSFLVGTDFTGKEFGIGDAIEQTIVPLPFREVGALLEDRGFTEAMILEALQQFGAGVATYEEFETKRNK